MFLSCSLFQGEKCFCTVTLPLKNEHGTGRPVEFEAQRPYLGMYSYPLTKLSTRFLLEWDPEEEKIPGGACYSAGRLTQLDLLIQWTIMAGEVGVLGCCVETGKSWKEAHRANPWLLCCFLKNSFIEVLYLHVINCIFLMWNFMLDTSICLWNHHHNPDIKQTYLSPSKASPALL